MGEKKYTGGEMLGQLHCKFRKNILEGTASELKTVKKGTSHRKSIPGRGESLCHVLEGETNLVEVRNRRGKYHWRECRKQSEVDSK